MKHIKPILLFLIVSFTFYTCSKNTSPVLEKKIRIINNVKKIGAIVVITGFESLLNRTDYLLVFSGVDFALYPDSIKNNSIYTHIPFGAVTGPLKILEKNEVIYSEKIIIEEESPDSSVVVKWFDLSYKIHKRDALLQSFDGLVEWQGTLSGDTISLSVAGFCGDECHFIFELRLKDVPSSDLPEFISLTCTFSDFYEGTVTDTLKSGIIKIQDYDVTGVISGKVFSKDWEPGGLTFWYDFSQPQNIAPYYPRPKTRK